MFPPAIVLVNGNTDGYEDPYGDLDSYTKQLLVSQLELNETMTSTEFDARVIVDPNYPTLVHLMNLRILVIKSNFHDYVNRQYMDVVLFVKGGLASIMLNNYGPPALTLPLDRINIYELLRYNNSPNTINLPTTPNYPFPRHGLGGIVADEMRDISGVHAPNPDNEFNNEAFIHRK